MKLVNTTSVYPFDYNPFDALQGLHRFGFEAADIALDYYTACPANGMDTPGWADNFQRLRALSDELGIPYTHAHSPFDIRALDNGEQNILLRRSIRAAAMLGAGMIVVHPVCRREDGSHIESLDEFLTVNTAYNRRLLPEAEEAGVILLTENLLWGVSTDPAAVAELTRETNSPFFGWCYDTGHANIFGFGADRLRKTCCAPLSLHIQDNHANGDEHLIPGDGTVDFPSVFAALKDIGYAGEFVLEAHHQSVTAPDETTRAAILTRLCGTARRLRRESFGE